MAQVTAGFVSVEDGLKKAEDYAPPRKVRVDLSFCVEEGEDFSAVFDHVSNAATNRVYALLHGTAIAAVNPGVGVSPAPAVAAATRTRRTKAQIEADNAAAAKAKDEDPTGGEEHVISLPDKSADPSDMGEFDTVGNEASAGGASGGTQTSGDAAGMDEWDVQPETDAAPITDADLNSAVQKQNAVLNAPNLIRDLIGSYNPDKSKPFQLRQIPAEQRKAFLDKLGELKKPAA